jgi:hypothetical protein
MTTRQLWLTGALLVVGASLLVQRPWQPTPQAGGGDVAPGVTSDADARTDALADLQLERLDRSSGEPPRLDRNLFRFETRRSAASTSGTSDPRPQATAPIAPPSAVGPPPPPPIPLRFIGYMESPEGAPRTGVLSDGRGSVFNGREGDIIEGRYRVLRIGVDSADLAYLDGRGQQTIRLSGQ